MMHNFNINSQQIDKIKKITTKEKIFRIKNLQLFEASGLPNKRLEDWKFSDFKEIINNNFKQIDTIKLANGSYHSSDFKYEEKNRIKISSYEQGSEYKFSKNPLICLNHALAEGGFSLEIDKNYKLKKVLVVYNLFTKDVENKILNYKNKINLNENSEVHIIEYVINGSKFINNVYENIILNKNAKLRSLYIQNNKSEGFFHKFLKNELSFQSDYSNLIFSSGLKFNKLDIECDLLEENSSCNILSALLLNKNEQQEIKTLINHLAPNCKSYQRVKNVLHAESKGIFQGKIYVKDNAQKTDAYQLSKALLLNDNAEFNSKPELEIYADDVKCSHGSTSGSIDEDSLHYLMTRGLSREESTRLLIKGFLNDIVEFIKSPTVKKFVESKLEKQLNGH